MFQRSLSKTFHAPQQPKNEMRMMTALATTMMISGVLEAAPPPSLSLEPILPRL